MNTNKITNFFNLIKNLNMQIFDKNDNCIYTNGELFSKKDLFENINILIQENINFEGNEYLIYTIMPSSPPALENSSTNENLNFELKIQKNIINKNKTTMEENKITLDKNKITLDENEITINENEKIFKENKATLNEKIETIKKDNIILKKQESIINDFQTKMKENESLSGIGSWERNSFGEIEISNQLKNIFGIDKSILTKEESINLIHPDDKSDTEKIVNNAFEHGREFKVVSRLAKLFRNKYKYIYYKGKPIFDENKKCIKTMGTVEDISELKYLKMKLENEKKDKISIDSIANLSHDIKSLLTAIMGISNLLELDNKEFGKKEYFIIMNNSIKELLVIVNDILDLSKINNCTNILTKKLYNLKNFVEEIVSIYSINKHLKIEIDIAKDLEEILYIDGKKYKQILNNLLSNAIKFTEIKFKDRNEIGKIVIKFEKEDNHYLKCCVIDTGIGISKEKMDLLFEPFVRIETKLKIEGTGLGLSICKKIVDLLNGKIGCESTLGEGSIFWFSIPL
jgi:nitrogen-specific signal transduction histidine kinase